MRSASRFAWLLIAPMGFVAFRRLAWAVDEHIRAGGLDLWLFRHTSWCLWSGGCDGYAPLSGYPPNLLAPHAHVIFWPLIGQTHVLAWMIWLGLGAASLAASIAIAARELRISWPPVVWLLVALLAIGSGFGMSHVRTGQIYLAMTLPLTIAWRWDRHQHRGLAVGAIVGALATIKPLLLLFLPWWLLRRRWKAAGAMLFTVALLVGCGLLIFGVETYQAYLTSLQLVANSASHADGSILQTITRNFARSAAFAPVAILPSVAAQVAAGLLIAVAGVTFWRAKDGDQGWLVILAAALLLAPKGWVHAAPWLLAPIAGVWMIGSRATRVLLAVSAAIMTAPETLPMLGQPNPWLTPWLGSMMFWMFVCAWLGGVITTARTETSSPLIRRSLP